MQALAHYHRQAKNIEMERQCIEIRIRAEKRAGEILKEMKENGERHNPGDSITRNGSWVKGDRSSSQTDDQKPTLKKLGISKNQSADWQRLAALPEEEFEEIAKGKKPKVQKRERSAIR